MTTVLSVIGLTRLKAENCSDIMLERFRDEDPNTYEKLLKQNIYAGKQFYGFIATEFATLLKNSVHQLSKKERTSIMDFYFKLALGPIFGHKETQVFLKELFAAKDLYVFNKQKFVRWMIFFVLLWAGVTIFTLEITQATVYCPRDTSQWKKTELVAWSFALLLSILSGIVLYFLYRPIHRKKKPKIHGKDIPPEPRPNDWFEGP